MATVTSIKKPTRAPREEHPSASATDYEVYCDWGVTLGVCSTLALADVKRRVAESGTWYFDEAATFLPEDTACPGADKCDAASVPTHTHTEYAPQGVACPEKGGAWRHWNFYAIPRGAGSRQPVKRPSAV